MTRCVKNSPLCQPGTRHDDAAGCEQRLEVLGKGQEPPADRIRNQVIENKLTLIVA